MTMLKDVAGYVRSKNAGPFWLTVDIFFLDARAFRDNANAPALSAERIAAIYGVDPAGVTRYDVPALNTIKFSLPRPTVQGGDVERDMHSGQSYVRLLDLDLYSNGAELAERGE
jgi:hypothetical protein